MSKIAYLMARNIHDATLAASEFGWVRLGSIRYAGPDKQDIRLCTIPGQIVCMEHPTDVYREKNWDALLELWEPMNRASFNELVESGQIRLVNEPVPTPPQEEPA